MFEAVVGTVNTRRAMSEWLRERSFDNSDSRELLEYLAAKSSEVRGVLCPEYGRPS